METVKVVFVFIVSLCLISFCASDDVQAEANSTDINSENTGIKTDLNKAVSETEHSDTEGVIPGDEKKSDIVNSETQKHSDTNGKNSDTNDFTPDIDDHSSDAGKVILDTGDQTPDASDLKPEDEDMVIMKLRELGGILDAKDIAEIMAEEQALEDGTEDIPEDTDDLKFEPIPMPTDFDSYDRNGDGLIDKEELIEVTGAFENIDEAFKVCDSNADGFLDRAEFKDAPWDLSGKPPEGGLEQL